ncbi:YbaK/EbsC family protein [Thermoactinospora rubra]|uniref:YbaK/EbsC family protein n=1 Tax=Thermoactinospora rubra TaxID=1088767 RepID=UPI000A1092F1|nr:YbaK/EbsC family protein [Thermoactinospora rubra]
MSLEWTPVAGRPDLLAEPVARAVRALEDPGRVLVAEIDPDLADTAAFCEKYGVSLEESANCVVVAARRGGVTGYAACVVLATMRVDVNNVVRKRLEARKASFAPMAEAVELTGMEYGGITPLGLPEGWPVLVDTAVAQHPRVIVGSGVRRSKLSVPGATLAGLANAEVLSLAN